MEKYYKCRKCEDTLDVKRKTRTCKKGGVCDFIETATYDSDPEVIRRREEEARRKAEKRARQEQREAEFRRRKANAEYQYQTYLNSSEGQAEIAKIANGYMARQRRASLGLVISGVVTLIAALICCIVFYKYIKYIVVETVEGSFLENFKEFFKSFLLASLPGSISYTLFQKFWKKRSKLRSELRSVHNTKTGRTVPVMEAARFFASRDISQRFAYEDEYGDSCVPDTLTPAPIDTTKECSDISCSASNMEDNSSHVTVNAGHAVLGLVVLTGVLCVGLYATQSIFSKTDKDESDGTAASQTREIKRRPDGVETYINRGKEHYLNGEYDLAIADFDKALELNTSDEEVYFYRGTMYFYKKDYDRAIADFTKAIELKPDFASAYQTRGAAYFYKEDYDRTITDIDKTLKLDSNNAEAYRFRGVVYYTQKDYSRASADFSKALELDPNNRDIKSLLEKAKKALREEE